MFFIKEMKLAKILKHFVAILGTGMSVKPLIAKINISDEHVAGVKDQGVVVVYSKPCLFCTEVIKLIDTYDWLFPIDVTLRVCSKSP